MADITMCKGTDCIIKEKCYRYTSEEGKLQSWFTNVPFEIKDNKFTCDMFWGENAEKIFNKLINITNIKEKEG